MEAGLDVKAEDDGSYLINNETYISKNLVYRDYECADRGMLLPLWSEYTWPSELRAFLYLLGLLYCFLGVAIIADIFMGSIEKITSKTRKVYLTSEKEDEPEIIEVRIWSDAVANLTLMALGSSAPEILLSIIEIIGLNFDSGELGPGTIVGSAAFNLFVISAVCVMFIPKGEIRRIKDIKVFAVTAVFSVVAYLWLLIIVVVVSPGEVEIWEAVVTLVLFPALVLLAWLAEKNFFGVPNKTDTSKQIELGNFQPGVAVEEGVAARCLACLGLRAPGSSQVVPADKFLREKQYFRDGRLDREGLVAFIKEVKNYPGLTDEDAAVLAASKLVESQSHSRMWYRVGAVRSMTGGRKTQPQISYKLKERSKDRLKTLIMLEDGTNQGVDNYLHNVYNAMNEHPEAPTVGEVPKVMPHKNAIIDFHSASCAVMENIGKFQVSICRSGKTDSRVSVRVETIDGTATVDQDYVPINEIITFESGETEKFIDVEIINDNQWEPDEEFFLKISLLMDQEQREGVQLGRISIMEITILNDDEPGLVMFQKRGFLVKESIGSAVIPVVRKNGADGEITVKWRTIDKSALSGRDFKGGEGELTFKHTETLQNIEIPIIDDMTPEKDEHFEIELFDPEGGAKLGQINRTAVTITNDDDFNNVLTNMMRMTNANVHALQVHHETYVSQIKDALNVNGGDIENATGMDYVLHFLTFGWKIIFALVPPPSILGGWLCFFVSLGVIGLLTAIVGDLASIFGCLVGLKDAVTAITFVALGTSLPDTFASKTAAVQEKHADNAIGNVTGSNSVNVFLGLGLPWFIAAVVNFVRAKPFLVAKGNLGFSVGLFTGLSVLTIGILMARRVLAVFGKAELGGPPVPRYLSGAVMICLWLIYVLFSSFQTYGYFDSVEKV
ncbi:sodium/calcium exchanger 2-like isoform X2 [Eriocheir sinensis]|uniref:sodium/calcium exchanger 2-like isoform X2 n=1 Tax=Eriocheir sinensis TaxID=95602 RepID=UPI0021C5EC10|nr:sodium/calcium exchanger 2-like isoform X2 [Eriocheir sinensis]